MLETIFQIVATLALMFCATYLISELFERLPPKLKEEYGPFGAKRFGFWGRVTNFHWEEYRVGYVVGWDVGHELRIYCEGEAQSGDDNFKKNAGVRLFANLDAYKRSNIIGWAESKGESIDVRLTLHPDQVRDILNELRNSADVSLHIHGWHDEKSIRVTHLSITP